MRTYLVSLALLLSITVHSKDDPKYPVSGIPENLKAGMYAVIREDFYRFEILAINKSRYRVHKAITILNQNGRNFATEAVFYDKLEKIQSISGIAYDSNGEVIKKLKSNEIVDRSAYDGSLFTDNRYKLMDLTQGAYPYTVEFDYEVERKFLYSIPPFNLYSNDEVSIQKEIFEIEYPPILKPRYKLNLLEEPRKEKVGANERLTWSYENIRPEKFEKFTSNRTVPFALIGPTDFEYDGYRGSMESWSALGKWQVLLNEGRGDLPELTVRKIKEITKDLISIEAKTKAVYEFLQSKTRYVSIQRGIGGFQPFNATVVDQNSYGDCKALSNYMVSMLREIGIRGHYTWIYGGHQDRFVPADFPTDPFNHIIVSVPNGKDTLWLECTSQTNPFGYTGNFTGDRYALMITEDGGKLVRTPKLKTEQNTQHRKAEVFLDKTGNAKAKVVTSFSGLQYENDNLDFAINHQSDDQKKWLQENIAIPSFEISSFSMVNKKDKIPTAIINIDLVLNRYASVSGKRLFITPNLMNKSTHLPPKIEIRKNPVVRKNSFIDVDSIIYHVPEEIYPEFLPQPVKISNRFGEYDATFKFDQGKLLYVRRLKMIPGESPARSYSELVDFYKSINKADNIKLVFLSKT